MKNPHIMMPRRERIVVIPQYRRAMAAFLFSVTALTASFAQAQWAPHMIQVGDGLGGQNLVSAQIQSLKKPGSFSTLPFGIVEMDNGELAMTTRVQEVEFGATSTAIAFSSDGGNSWDEWTTIPVSATELTYLGGGRLSTLGSAAREFSSDYGRTWVEQVPNPQTTGGATFFPGITEEVDFGVNGNVTKIHSLGWNFSPAGTFTPEALGFYRSSTDGGMTWQNEVTPAQWDFEVQSGGQTYTRGVSEGSIVRAANGDLIAALRTDKLPEHIPLNDNFEGTAISISKDNGQTWSELNRLYDAGRHHGNLQRMPNGALVMTMIVRNDIRGPINGTSADLTTSMVGADAMVSLDNGLTWDLQRRITLDDFANPLAFPNTVVGNTGAVALSDGSMISAYGSIAAGAEGATLVKWDPTLALGPAIELRVNRLDGTTRIVGVGGGSVDLDGYTIASATSSNVWVPGNWNSITDQDGGTWSEVPPTAPLTEQQALSELNLSGSKSIASAGVVSLGSIYDTLDTEEDIKFTYGIDGNANPQIGLVVFEGEGLRLRVNKTTGKVEIINVETIDLNLDAYTIQSASGDLDFAAWNSLEDQTVTGWEEVNPGSSAISELNLTSSSLLAAGGSLNLGAAYQGGVNGAEDLSFTFNLPGVKVLEGVIEYVAAIDGDFDVDSDVDGFDFLLWQRSLGDATNLAIWEANFGTPAALSAATASTAAVPEPSSLVLLALAGLGCLARRKCR